MRSPRDRCFVSRTIACVVVIAVLCLTGWGGAARAQLRQARLHLERQERFDAEFIALARSVYIENDQRAAIKKRINLALGGKLLEEKSYQHYR